MLLAEKEVTINNICLREVRRKTESGHQTSIVTTNKKLDLKDIALHMFARWSQENFFRYMRQDYAFDKMAQHAIEQIDESGKNNARQVMLEKEMEELKGQEQIMLDKLNAIYPDTDLRLYYKMAM
jgi:hypothetical protein